MRPEDKIVSTVPISLHKLTPVRVGQGRKYIFQMIIQIIFLRIKNGKWLIGAQLNIRAIEHQCILLDLSEEIAMKFVEKRTDKHATMPMVELKMPKTVIYLDCQTKEDLKIIEESILNKCTSPMNTKNVSKNTVLWYYVLRIKIMRQGRP